MSAFVTYVIRLPEAQDAKRAVTTGVRELVESHGGEITGMSNEDEMTVLDLIERHEDIQGHIVDEARVQAKSLCSEITN